MAVRTLLLAASLLSAGAVARGEEISVAFPAEGQRLPFVEQAYVIGAVAPGRTEQLYVNGVTTSVYRTGAFVQMVPVEPGTNTLTLCRAGERLVRRFVVAPQSAVSSAAPPEPILSDDDPRLGPQLGWKTIGGLFSNRVRSAPDAGDSLFFLPRGFALRGAQVRGTAWVAVWLENVRGYLPCKSLARLPDDVRVPPKGLIAPDPAVGFADHPPYDRPTSSVRVCVDAGHGGSDPGSLSPHGWKEKDANLLQAQAIRDALEKAGFQVLMTRDGDSFPELLERPALAYRERVDAFVSVHHNSTHPGRDPRVARHTTAYASTSNGLALARCIQKHVARVMEPVRDAGAQMKSLAVCRNPAVPSCLLEIDFINLPEGEEASWSSERRRRIADAVVYGLVDWMTPPPPPSKSETAPTEGAARP